MATPEEELAAVIHYAAAGFPEEGKSLTIQPPFKGSALYDELLRIAEEMERQGKISIGKDLFGYSYIGKDSHVRESMRITNRRKPELLADEEQHIAIGRLLGYDEKAIKEFLGRLKPGLP